MNTNNPDLGGQPMDPKEPNEVHDALLDDQETAFDFEDVVSGEFDAELIRAEAAPEKRVLLPQPESPKLHKVLAQSGMGSRIEMERLIAEGHVAVNNEVAHTGQRVQFGDQIKVNGRPIKVRIAPPPPRVIAYHKPAGEVVTTDDPQNRPTVFRRLPRLYQGKWQSVGRLDLNTEGLLLFTSSGELANQLMHPRFGLQREYAVRSLGKLSKDQKEQLITGIQLDDGPAQFGSIEEGGGEGSNCWYRVTISEGRNREVRRMFEAVGHAVSRLIRIRYGAMVLPRGLKRGAFVELGERDIRALMEAAGAEAPVQSGPSHNNRTERASSRRRGNSIGPRPATPRAPEERNSGPERLVRTERRRGGKLPERAPQPDPMQTSVAYIGADSYAVERQRKKDGQKAFKAGLVGGPRPTSSGPRRGGSAGGGFGGGRSGGGTAGGNGGGSGGSRGQGGRGGR
ncbi:pseudouridine synthase [Limnohabitans sp.]|uniref:pseudouridine synthase n=1 Tax=Limnohabitans sp. TaxID=1907725 RepID=UPI003FA5F057